MSYTIHYTKLKRVIAAFVTLLVGWSALYSQGVRSYCIEVSCSSRTLNSTQSILDFSWPYKTPTATNQFVYRKRKGEYKWGSKYRTLGTSDSTFSDTISTGAAYEYMIEKDNGPDGWPVYGYIYASNRMPAVTSRGTILILVDSTHKSFLSNTLRTYRNDLIGDGWNTVLKYFSPSTTVAQIKSYIYSTYSASPNTVKSVVLVGNLAVPYSGDFSASNYYPPDGHTTTSGPSHEGAWSTDLYYGDMINSTWPDSTVNNTIGARPANHNVPNDGKFDITELPNILQLQVGRIDLSEMTEFKYDVPDSNNIERELLKRYFQKNHDFKHRNVVIQERCLYANTIADVISGSPIDEHWPTNAYGNMAPLISKNVTTKVSTYLSTLNSNAYLWSFAFGAGKYNQNNAVGYTLDLASTSQQLKTVFSGFLSSYCADFDTANNFLRAPLAAKGNVLNTFWVGRPAWFFHHMGLGENIGYSSMRTQNNYDSVLSSSYGYAAALYPTTAYFGFEIHSSLMGDPAVRMQYVEPASNFYVRQDSCNNRFKLRWTAVSDTAVHTYYIFRAKHIDSTFTLIGSSSTTSYTDNSPLSGTNVYMLRAEKLQVSGSGTYYNLSQGVFDTVSTADFSTPLVDAGRDTLVCKGQYIRLGVHNNNASQVTFSWSPTANSSDTATVLTGSAGNRILIGTDTLSGCIKRDTMTISLKSTPVFETISMTGNSCNDTVNWSSTNNNGSAYNYAWTFSGANPGSSAGLGLINPSAVTYGTSGNYATTLTVKDTSTNCTNTMGLGVTVTCSALPVKWANLNCTKTDEKFWVNFNLYNSELYREIYIEALNQQHEWIRLKTLEKPEDGQYRYAFEGTQLYHGIRINSISTVGAEDILDICNWDSDGVQLNVYPNPFSGEFHIDFTSSLAFLNSSVTIYNNLGQIVYQSDYAFVNGTLSIDGSDWATGLYTLRINDGQKAYSLQFVK